MESYASFLTESSNKKKKLGTKLRDLVSKGVALQAQQTNLKPQNPHWMYLSWWLELAREAEICRSLDSLTSELNMTSSMPGRDLVSSRVDATWGMTLEVVSGTHIHECAPVSPYISPTHEHVYTLTSTKMPNVWYFPGLHTKVISFHSYVLSLQITQA